MDAQLFTWCSPPKTYTLSGTEIDVWQIDLEQPSERVEGFLEVLVHDERERANRFHFAEHRRHFIVARGFLRLLLSRYLEADPRDLRFHYGEYGKPALDSEHRTSGLRFNLSHSNGLAVYAITYHREIGIDVEHIRADFPNEEIARRFFSRLEVKAFCALPSEQRVSAFFRCWTRKEAYIKATGRGLSQSLEGFDVTLRPEEPAALLRNDSDSEATARWCLCDIEVGPDYAGALALECLSNSKIEHVRL